MAADDSYTAADERARAARRAGIQAKKDEQPANTARSYAAKQREWKAWCHTPRAAADGSLYSWPDGELVTPDKLAAWLKEDILGDGNGEAVQVRQQREQEQLEAAAMAEAESLAEALEVPLAEAAELLADDREGYVPPTGLATAAVDLTEGSLLTRGTIDAYIAAVIELWRLQVAHGNSNTENPRGAAVRGFLEQRGRQRGKHDRASFKDRGSDGIQAGYLPDEWLRIQDLLLTGAAYTPQNLRTRVDLLFGHYYLLRGENRRKMELADLSLLDYPPSEGPTPCGCLGPSTALLWRWHVAGEPPRPSGAVRTGIGSRSSSGGTASRSSYPTQLQETWRIFGAAGLIASKKTHLPRRVGAQDAETHGTSLAQISQAGRWNQSVLCQAYLTHLPRQFMRIVAGFSASPGDYFLARAAHEPPGPEWDEFAVAVRSTAVGAMEPNSQRLAIRLEARLDGIQGGLDALLQGKVPITFTGYFGAGSAEALAPAPAPAPSTVPTLNLNTAPAPTQSLWYQACLSSQPWQGSLRRPYGSWKRRGKPLAPGNGVRVQFCRRKVIWDELLARMASGKCKEAAVAELELLRAGRSLNRLVDELKQRRRRGQDRGQGQGQIRVQVGTPVPDDPGPGRDQVQLEVRAVGAEDPAGKADRPRRRKPAAS
ncbi:centromere DNA-binding protein complex CBF3 subunit [Hirsutella rhossiliensis]|uniref:Centromere DNA-binding protein complex CBF3 subunit n=1 Tax=Hirsutella rhossiliensis TaxID=111463 RepID=A0A9P8N3I0_9HYPO|nr:centromere DNA-binding protein complex CBF3 subunit [Hirsutella rhossiliensis]KAH0966257.1 centromere DNA-binding protein complex CBF3 subunit [Hirsutella rhossiliensis]